MNPKIACHGPSPSEEVLCILPTAQYAQLYTGQS
jgi:hypothetical protein